MKGNNQEQEVCPQEDREALVRERVKDGVGLGKFYRNATSFGTECSREFGSNELIPRWVEIDEKITTPFSAGFYA